MAKGLQEGLQKLAKPWWARRSLRVFRDSTHLLAGPDLDDDIKKALEASRFFILLATPRSAVSREVRIEVQNWQAIHEEAPAVGRERFLIAWLDGDIGFTSDPPGIDWRPDRTNALPTELRSWWRGRPLAAKFKDLSLRDGQPNLRSAEFASLVATLAAPIHGVDKDELAGIDLAEHRKARRLRRGAITSIALLSLAAALGVYRAEVERGRADHAESVGLSRQLAKESIDRLTENPAAGARLALASYAASPTPQSKAALMASQDRHRHVLAYVRKPDPLSVRGLAKCVLGQQ